MYDVDCFSTNVKTKVNIRSDYLMSLQEKKIVLKSSIIKHTGNLTLAIHKLLGEFCVFIQTTTIKLTTTKNSKLSLVGLLIY